MDAVPKRAMQGRLEVFGDKGAPRPLLPGDRVRAKYQGNPKHAWFTATAVALNADGTWHIQYDDMEEEDVHVYRPGTCMPCIMHMDGCYVPMPLRAPARDVQSRAKGSRARIKTKVRHTGFRYMRVDPVAADAQDQRDGLATRMHFMYQEQLVREGKVTRTDVKYITLQDIVQDTNAKSARVQRALLEFMVHLYTTPPVSTENMQHLLGPHVTAGWSATERKRVERNFAVFKQAQEQEEDRRAKKAKGSQ